MINEADCKEVSMEFSISKHLGFTDEEIAAAFAEEESFELPLKTRKVRSEILRARQTAPLQ
jgi:hypothetical protein